LNAIITNENGSHYVNFYTGTPIKNDSIFIDELCNISMRHPYPGDLTAEGGIWVIDIARCLTQLYAPQLMMMFIAQPLLMGLNLPYDDVWKKAVNSLFGELRLFVKNSNYVPIILGMGSLTQFKSLVDTSNLDGYVASSLWTYHHAGVYGATSQDYEKLKNNPSIKHIVSREEFALKYGISDSLYLEEFPDYHITAVEGYAFEGIKGHERTLYRIPAQEKYIPVYTELDSPKNILDIKKIVNEGIDSGKKIALILIEGVGSDIFPYTYNLCKNYDDWYTYDHSINQYFAITTGLPFYSNSFPPICNHQALRKETNDPRSLFKTAFFSDFPANAIGRRPDIRSVAVGSRSVTTHACSGADISVECFCRNLANVGVCTVLNDPK
jgi:hypothetical protein